MTCKITTKFSNMQIKEEKICSFTQKGHRLQLLKTSINILGIKGDIQPLIRYQVRLNRKVVNSSISEYQERKVFATYCQNIVLQLKIC